MKNTTIEKPIRANSQVVVLGVMAETEELNQYFKVVMPYILGILPLCFSKKNGRNTNRWQREIWLSIVIEA